MTDEADNELEVVQAESLCLADGECWIADPEFLAHDSGVQGVIGVQYRGGELWYLDGESRKWLNAECDKPRAKLRPIQ